MLAVHGSIATSATDVATPGIPFWPLLFKNVRVDFLGSDDFAPANKAKAAEAVNEALAAGWGGFEIAEQFPLEEIATAHERVEAAATTRPHRAGGLRWSANHRSASTRSP